MLQRFHTGFGTKATFAPPYRLSEKFASGNMSSNSGGTLLAGSDEQFRLGFDRPILRCTRIAGVGRLVCTIPFANKYNILPFTAGNCPVSRRLVRNRTEQPIDSDEQIGKYSCYRHLEEAMLEKQLQWSTPTTFFS